MLRTPRLDPDRHPASRRCSMMHLSIREIIHGVLIDVLGWVCSSSATAASARASARSISSSAAIAWSPTTRQIRTPRSQRSSDRRLPRADALSHGAARPRHHQRQGSVRRGRDACVQARRARRATRALGQHREYDRLGLDENVYELFGVRVPLICMPVAPGRNLATLVEVAAGISCCARVG